MPNGAAAKDRPMTSAQERQATLQDHLVTAIIDTVPLQVHADSSCDRLRSSYQWIAEILVDLRHEFPGTNGTRHDLVGRSAGYRTAVGQAYLQAGAQLSETIPKRLTVGVSYWVRKLLLERYGPEKLCELGVLPEANEEKKTRLTNGLELPDDPVARLQFVAGVLNDLVTMVEVVLPDEAIQSGLRALRLLERSAKMRQAHIA